MNEANLIPIGNYTSTTTTGVVVIGDGTTPTTSTTTTLSTILTSRITYINEGRIVGLPFLLGSQGQLDLRFGPTLCWVNRGCSVRGDEPTISFARPRIQIPAFLVVSRAR